MCVGRCVSVCGVWGGHKEYCVCVSVCVGGGTNDYIMKAPGVLHDASLEQGFI